MKRYESSPGKHRWFCGSCGSQLISTRDGDGETLLLRAGCIDRGPERGPVAHGWVESKAPWHEITDELPRFARGFPGAPPAQTSRELPDEAVAPAEVQRVDSPPMRFPVLLALLALLACGPVPGGSLSGSPAEPLDGWSTLIDERNICESESRFDDPHSIQLECFLFEDALYVQSHRWALASWWSTTSWAAIWIQQPQVRVRLDDRLFELRAAQVTEPERRERILRFRGYDPVPEGIVLFRFDHRS